MMSLSFGAIYRLRYPPAGVAEDVLSTAVVQVAAPPRSRSSGILGGTCTTMRTSQKGEK